MHINGPAYARRKGGTIKMALLVVAIIFHQLENVALGIAKKSDAKALAEVGKLDDGVDGNAVGLQAFDRRLQPGNVKGEMAKPDRSLAAFGVGRKRLVGTGWKQFQSHGAQLEHEKFTRRAALEGARAFEAKMLGIKRQIEMI
jgi:hypothetical protein